MTDLRVSLKEPSLSAEEQVTLTKQAPTDTVYKILNTKKDAGSRNGRLLKKRKQREEEEGSTKRKFECHICNSQQVSRTNLYSHYALGHFREEMKGAVGESGKDCHHCGKTFSTQDQLICHMGSTHNKVEDYLPQNYHIPKSKRGRKAKKTDEMEEHSSSRDKKREERDKKGSIMEKERDAFDGKSLVDAAKEVQPTKSLQCHICQVTKSKRSLLNAHYAHRHFRHQLIESIENKNSLQCGDCGTLQTSIENLAFHIGVVHKKVEDFLPENYYPTSQDENLQPIDETNIQNNNNEAVEEVETPPPSEV